jgi:Zn-dependent M28 family amino/carboxypeptidase
VSWLEPIGDEVRRELGRFPPVAGMAAIVAGWLAAVGDSIARNAWPARLARDGTLHVSTSSSAWSFELTQLRGEILPRLRSAVGTEAVITDLRFAPGRLPEAASEETAEASWARVEVDAESAAEGERLAAAVGDETLRKLVARAAAASLARAATDRSFW